MDAKQTGPVTTPNEPVTPVTAETKATQTAAHAAEQKPATEPAK